MSQMHPYLRAYRQALRDVQRAVLLHGQTLSYPGSARFAISAAADAISTPLRELREGITSLESAVIEEMSNHPTKDTAFAQGYQTGFDKALDVVGEWGRKMNNPVARDAIGDVVNKLKDLSD